MKLVDSSPYVAIYYIFEGLASAEAAYKSKGMKRKWHLAQARQMQTILQRLAQPCPHSLLHKLYVLKGEIFAVKGNLGRAMEWFGLAIENAKTVGVPQMQALAHERASVACHRLGSSALHAERAQSHLEKAIQLYSQWGAVAIVDHLKKNCLE